MSELRKWDTMPDVDGWYWFDGEEEGEWLGEWFRIQCVVEILNNRSWVVRHHDEESCEADILGTWYGPLTPPWETDND